MNIVRGRSDLGVTLRMLDDLTMVPQEGQVAMEVRSMVLILGTMIENSVQNLFNIVRDLNRLQVATLTGTGIVEYDEELFDEGESPSVDGSE